MKYFLDTEFVEGPQKQNWWRKKQTKPTIDLISIGIVCEDGRELYLVSKDFNLKHAWNDKWIRENVLKPIHEDLRKRMSPYYKTYWHHMFDPFTKKSMKFLLGTMGHNVFQMREAIAEFVYPDVNCVSLSVLQGMPDVFDTASKRKPVFYAYFADYDWVVFCWIFGKMMKLPYGFPMYCRDLKQMMDDRGLDKEWKQKVCPDPEGEHNALVDARWNKTLFEAIREETTLTYK